MGRVSRYKKVKNSIKTFGQLLGSSKNNDPVVFQKNKVEIAGFSLEDESKRSKRKMKEMTGEFLEELSNKRNLEDKKRAEKSDQVLKRQKNESLRDFESRLTLETNSRIQSSIKKNTNTFKKKIEFLKKRKEKKNQKKHLTQLVNKIGGASTDGLRTRRVGVHDVVVEPPNLKFSKSDNARFKKMNRISSFFA